MMTQFSQILCPPTGFCTFHTHQSIINCNSLVLVLPGQDHENECPSSRALELPFGRLGHRTYGRKRTNALKECNKCLYSYYIWFIYVYFLHLLTINAAILMFFCLLGGVSTYLGSCSIQLHLPIDLKV